MGQRAVDVEVLLMGLDEDGRLGWLARRRALGDDVPDQAALAIADEPSASLAHSTSWRDDDGVLVLTYAVVATERAPRALVVEPSVVCSDDPHRPAPPVLHLHHVVAHAVRHLSDLLRRDPVVVTALAGDRELVRALHDAAAAMPVAPHSRAHELARARAPAPSVR